MSFGNQKILNKIMCRKQKLIEKSKRKRKVSKYQKSDTTLHKQGKICREIKEMDRKNQCFLLFPYHLKSDFQCVLVRPCVYVRV